jgi:hypothetical protein
MPRCVELALAVVAVLVSVAEKQKTQQWSGAPGRRGRVP